MMGMIVAAKELDTFASALAMPRAQTMFVSALSKGSLSIWYR